MAAVLDVNIMCEVTGLGKIQSFLERATDGTAPTALTYNYRTLTTADTAEALDLGDVSTVTGIAIRAVGSYDVDVDLDNATDDPDDFDADFTIKAGEPAAYIPNPAGNVYVKNNGESETPSYEYWCCGTT